MNNNRQKWVSMFLNNHRYIALKDLTASIKQYWFSPRKTPSFGFCLLLCFINKLRIIMNHTKLPMCAQFGYTLDYA